jgi:hypothetical protein
MLSCFSSINSYFDQWHVRKQGGFNNKKKKETLRQRNAKLRERRAKKKMQCNDERKKNIRKAMIETLRSWNATTKEKERK